MNNATSHTDASPDLRHPLETSLYKIGEPLILRGHRLCVVLPNKKRGIRHDQFKCPIDSLAELLMFAKAYPDHRVGVVCRRRPGEDIVLDLDAPGVAHRILAECGVEISQTHCVQSRPKSAPWKLHAYYKHTVYSVAKFKVEIHIADYDQPLRPDKAMTPPPLLDAIGSGAGNLVVAEGTYRPETNEYYTGDDKPLLPIPDALVDWLLNLYVAFTKERRLRNREARELQKTIGRIPATEILRFINSSVMTYVKLGEPRSAIPAMVERRIKRYMENGAALAKENRERIRAYVRRIPEKKFGKPAVSMLPDLPMLSTTTPEGDLILRPAEDLLIKVATTVPAEVRDIVAKMAPGCTSSEIRQQVIKKLAKKKLALPQGHAGTNVINKALRQNARKVIAREGNERTWS